MKSDAMLNACVWMVIGAVLLAVIDLCVGNAPYQQYRKGQIDALTGVVKYELREHSDGTKTWERKEDK